VLLAVCALVVALAGCGGDRSQTGATGIGQGAEIFQRSCAGCHTLDAPTRKSSGGDLAQTTLSISDLVSFARIMPVELTRDQLEAVARYIHAVETGRAARATRH
jgi:mono/diheme cytochrome c family protein